MPEKEKDMTVEDDEITADEAVPLYEKEIKKRDNIIKDLEGRIKTLEGTKKGKKA